MTIARAVFLNANQIHVLRSLANLDLARSIKLEISRSDRGDVEGLSERILKFVLFANEMALPLSIYEESISRSGVKSANILLDGFRFNYFTSVLAIGVAAEEFSKVSVEAYENIVKPVIEAIPAIQEAFEEAPYVDPATFKMGPTSNGSDMVN